MKFAPTTPEAVMLSELGDRAQRHRVGMNLTQAELAKSAGVSQRTVERLENGNSVQLETMLRIMRALRLSGNLDQLIPETSVRPIHLAGSKSDVRQRSYKRRSAEPKEKTTGWVWGDKK